MSHYVRFINIPESRARIVAAINRTQARISLMDNLRAFLETLPREPVPKGSGAPLGALQPLKKLNAGIGGKLHEYFIATAPHLKVARVAYAAEKTTSFMARGQLSIFVYEDSASQPMAQGYMLQQNLDGSLDLNVTFVSYEVEVAQHAHLRAHLPQFARTAQRFNDALSKLRDVAKVAKPENSIHPSYPLSEIYHWYELSSPGIQAADPEPLIIVPGGPAS